MLIIILLYSCDRSKKVNYIDWTDKFNQRLSNQEAQKNFDKGDQFLVNSEFDSALACFNKSLSQENHTLTYNQIGVCEVLKDSIEKAIVYHNLGIKVDSTYNINYLNLSKCYIRKNDIETAKKYYLKVIENNNSKHFVALASLHLSAIYYNQSKDCSEILKYFEMAESIKNDDRVSDFYEKCKNKIEKHCK